MSKIISIGTALPPYKHQQCNILQFMLDVYNVSLSDKRKIELLYDHCGIESRYSVIPDYSLPVGERVFYPRSNDLEPFPTLEKRMDCYHVHALPLSIRAIEGCMDHHIDKSDITHLVTVSCTGMSAPGIDIQIMQEMQLGRSIYRTSVNFMGCYAAIHALKMADAICTADSSAKVMIVCTELCTLHFQKEFNMNNMVAALLFSDGAAAVLVAGNDHREKGLHISGFYSEVDLEGKPDMAWNISEKGFLMTLSAYIPQLIQSGIESLLQRTLDTHGIKKKDITHWAIHPGGKKILQTVQQELQLQEDDLKCSFEVLRRYGNMSSPTILFVLREIMQQLKWNQKEKIFTSAFGPGLTLETAILQT